MTASGFDFAGYQGAIRGTEMTDQPKTWKRETAWVLLAFWAVVTTASIFYPEALEPAEMIQWPIFGFALAAFGLDAAGKQLGFGK